MEEVAFEQVSEEVGGLGVRLCKPVRRGEGTNVGGWQDELGDWARRMYTVDAVCSTQCCVVT